MLTDHGMEDSRTYKSIKNSVVSLVFYFATLVLNFVSRKVFITHLGADVLGLNTTLVSILQFLNLAELGVGVAVAHSLYKPLHDKDYKTINEIISLQGWIYRRIAILIILLSCIVLLCFPYIFKNIELPLWYAFASFMALITSALLSYFFNYRQVILTADQKDYKVIYSYKATQLIKVIVQIVAISYSSNGYIWWLVLEVTFAVLSTVSLSNVISRAYPFLKSTHTNSKTLRQKYKNVFVKTKQLFLHKIGTFALTQSSTIVVYAYESLAVVAMYGNYMLIISGVSSLMTTMFSSINGGVGNLVASGNKTNIYKVFEELFSIRFLMAMICCYGVYIISPHFVSLWVGSEYILNNKVVFLMVLLLYIGISRATVDNYINAYGLFFDIWAPFVEGVLNIGLSALLGYYFGLEGILTGVLISQVLIILIWKPYLLYCKGLEMPVSKYVKMHIKYLIIALVMTLVFVAYPPIPLVGIENWWNLIWRGGTNVVVYGFLNTITMYCVSSGFRRFVSRMCNIIKTK